MGGPPVYLHGLFEHIINPAKNSLDNTFNSSNYASHLYTFSLPSHTLCLFFFSSSNHEKCVHMDKLGGKTLTLKMFEMLVS
jgi:hypothetical protein